MNGVMKVSEFERLQKKMQLIPSESIKQFASDVIDWYEYAFYIQIAKHYPKAEANLPPNLFRLFEYYSNTGTTVLEHFGDSWHQEEAQQDVTAVLNAYKLFYIFQDDAHPRVRYYNHFGGEVW